MTQIPVNSKYTTTKTADGIEVGVNSTDDVPENRRQCGEYVNDYLNG